MYRLKPINNKLNWSKTLFSRLYHNNSIYLNAVANESYSKLRNIGISALLIVVKLH